MFLIDRSNVSILIRICQDLGGIPATVKDFTTVEEQVMFLQTPPIVKALQVFYRIVPVKSLSWVELEWLQSKHFLDIWHKHHTNLNRAWIEAHRDPAAEPLRQYFKSHFHSPTPHLTPEERLELTEILFEQGHCVFDEVPRLGSMSDRAMVRGTCRGGHLGVLQSIERRLGKRHPETLVWASEFGRLDICHYITESCDMNFAIQRNAVNKAIENDHLEVVQYLLSKCPEALGMQPAMVVQILELASFHGSIRILEHFQPTDSENHRTTFCHAALMHIRTLKWLWPNHQEWANKALFAGWHAGTAVQDSELLQWWIQDPQIGLSTIMDALVLSEQWSDFMRLLWQYPNEYHPTVENVSTIVYCVICLTNVNDTLQEPHLLHFLCQYLLTETGFQLTQEFWEAILSWRSLDVLIYLDQTHLVSNWQGIDAVIKSGRLDFVVPAAIVDWIQAKRRIGNA